MANALKSMKDNNRFVSTTNRNLKRAETLNNNPSVLQSVVDLITVELPPVITAANMVHKAAF